MGCSCLDCLGTGPLRRRGCARPELTAPRLVHPGAPSSAGGSVSSVARGQLQCGRQALDGPGGCRPRPRQPPHVRDKPSSQSQASTGSSLPTVAVAHLPENFTLTPRPCVGALLLCTVPRTSPDGLFWVLREKNYNPCENILQK